MSEINRRTLISMAGIAGAGLALTGCSEERHSTSEPVGECDLAGQSVRDLKPEKDGGVKKCVPKYICIVYIKFEQDWKLKVRRTYIGPLTLDPDPTLVASMAQLVLAKLADTGQYNQYDKYDIDPIHLGSQQILVIYIDNPTNRIRFKYDPNDYNHVDHNHSFDHTIRFVKYSSKGPSIFIRDNHSFFNILKMDITKGGTNLTSDVAFRLDYWNTNEMGQEVTNVTLGNPASHFLYSMNIHLEIYSPIPMPDGSMAEKWVPLILDPDTGNMGGQP